MRIRITNIPKAQFGLEEEVPLAELEKGEIYESTGETINKISDDGRTHEQGGEVVDDAKRVLENTSSRRQDPVSKNLKLSPEEIYEATGVEVKKPMTHSKAFEAVSDYYNKRAKKIGKKLNNNKTSVKGWDDKYAENSMDVNLKALENNPTDSEIFDALFNLQEQKKEAMGLIEGPSNFEMPMGQWGLSNDPATIKARTEGEAAEAEYDKLMRIRAEGEAAEEEYDLMMAQKNNRPIGVPERKFNEPLRWFDVAGDIMALKSSARRAPVQSYQIDTAQYSPRTMSAQPYLDKSQSDFNAATNRFGNRGTDKANIANLFALKRQADNQSLGVVEAQNNQILNDANLKESIRRGTQSEIDTRTRADFDNRFLSSMENQRLSQLTGFDSLFSKLAMNQKLNREGDLMMQMYNYFDQFGRYNDNPYIFRDGMPTLGIQGDGNNIRRHKVPMAYNSQAGYLYTMPNKRGDERRMHMETPPTETNLFRLFGNNKRGR